MLMIRLHYKEPRMDCKIAIFVISSVLSVICYDYFSSHVYIMKIDSIK